MRLFDWLRKTSRRDDRRLRAWRASWLEAVDAADAGRLAALESSLRQSPPLGEDLEMEEEMLDGLRRLVELNDRLAAASLPTIETSHRVLGSDRCHFIAPVSMPDDPAQPTGRLLLTSVRAVFAGGGRTPALPWHAVREVIQTERDLLLVRLGTDDGYRFRCNSFADALCAAAIARHLMRRARL